jgi:hypothetical protein
MDGNALPHITGGFVAASWSSGLRTGQRPLSSTCVGQEKGVGSLYGVRTPEKTPDPIFSPLVMHSVYPANLVPCAEQR